VQRLCAFFATLTAEILHTTEHCGTTRAIFSPAQIGCTTETATMRRTGHMCRVSVTRGSFHEPIFTPGPLFNTCRSLLSAVCCRSCPKLWLHGPGPAVPPLRHPTTPSHGGSPGDSPTAFSVSAICERKRGARSGRDGALGRPLFRRRPRGGGARRWDATLSPRTAGAASSSGGSFSEWKRVAERTDAPLGGRRAPPKTG